MTNRSCCLGLVLALAATCAAGAEVELERMTSPELRAAVAAGTTTALIPIGGTEQNGAHMVLGKHNRRVQVLAERIAHELGNAVVAPTLAYVPEGAIDPPAGHMRWAGTLSVPEAAFEAVLEGTAASLARHGLRDIFLLGDHGGYQAALARVAARFNRSRAARGGARVHALDAYYRAGQGEFAAWLKTQGYAAAAIGEHAGLLDTSLALAVDPTLVRRELLARIPLQGERDGVRGDPTQASAELGAAGVARIVAASVQAIRTQVRR
ncbi:MAG: creatinine amidohydrolase [Pseudomonadota bacterium]|nr:creatininase family protein [Rubrivivax sp.]